MLLMKRSQKYASTGPVMNKKICSTVDTGTSHNSALLLITQVSVSRKSSSMIITDTFMNVLLTGSFLSRRIPAMNITMPSRIIAMILISTLRKISICRITLMTRLYNCLSLKKGKNSYNEKQGFKTPA
jgi:hypothetical protein